MSNTTTLDFDFGRMRFRFARTARPRVSRGASLRTGLAGVMPLAQSLKIFVSMVVAWPYMVDLIGVLAAQMP